MSGLVLGPHKLNSTWERAKRETVIQESRGAARGRPAAGAGGAAWSGGEKRAAQAAHVPVSLCRRRGSLTRPPHTHPCPFPVADGLSASCSRPSAPRWGPRGSRSASLGNSGALRRGAIPPPGNLRSPRPAAPHLSPRFCGAAEPVPGLRAPPPPPVPPRAPPAASVPAAKGALGRGTQCGCCWHRGSVCRPRSAACQQHPREHPLFPEALRPPGSRALRCAALRAPAAASRSPALRVRVTSSSVALAGPVQSQGWKVCLDAPRTPERGLRPGLRP